MILYRACSLYVLIDYVLYIMKCSKQPHESVLCGFYVCKYLRACGKFSISYKQLTKSLDWWRKERVTEKNFTQTIADICSFISHKCVHVGRVFFNEESEVAYEEKCENIRNWITKLSVPDYKLLDLFGLGHNERGS